MAIQVNGVPAFKGRDDGNSTSPLIPAVLVGGATTLGVKQFAPSKEMTKDEFVKKVQAGEKIEYTGELDTKEKAAQTSIDNFVKKTAVPAKEGKAKVPSVETTDKELEKILNDIFHKRSEVNVSRILQGSTTKKLVTEVKGDQSATDKQQKLYDELSEKHNQLQSELDDTKEAANRDAQKSIKDLEDISPDEEKTAKKGAENAEAASKKAKDAYTSARQEADAAKKASDADPSNKKLKAEAERKEKTAQAKEEAFKEKQVKAEIAKREAVTKKAKLEYVEADETAKKAEKAKAPDAAAKREIATKKKEAAQKAIDAEIEYKKGRIAPLEAEIKRVKKAAEKAKTKLDADLRDLEVKQARLSVAEAAKESGSKKITRETFKSELAGKVKAVSEKTPSVLESAFESLKGKLPKVKPTWGKAGIYGGVAAVAAFIVAAVFSKKPHNEEQTQA